VIERSERMEEWRKEEVTKNSKVMFEKRMQGGRE
jgi:hypothetical protein